MKRVIISVSNDLITDQRVFKTCLTFQELGYDILLVGRKKGSKSTIKRNYKTKRLRLLFQHGPLFYAEFNLKLFFLLLFSRKDMLFANDVDTLIPNYLISKLSGTKIIFDSHELFSEVPELQNKKFVRSVWLKIESSIIPKLKHIITVSDSIKNYYKQHYGIESTVIRNVPIQTGVEKKQFSFSTKAKKILLYQGSVNLGRGLELMIDTMKDLDNFLFVIIGDGDIMENLEEKVLMEGLENKVKFLGRLHPNELKSLTPNADLGISLEEDLGLNYRFALPNKIFDYIQSEVPVIVSDLPDMKDLVSRYKVGEVLHERNTKALAELINLTLDKDYRKELKEAKKKLNWTNEKQKLIKVISA